MFKIGQILDNKYEILEHIGTGGGGIVYKAYQQGLGRTVAIKQIKDDVSGVLDEHGEANILKNLKNDYIPSVYDFITCDGKVYTIMEFIEGKSFQEIIESGRIFSQKEMLKYSRQLCTAVSYLHSRKSPVIHSDIKPANIMLTKEDNICLIDYNISLIVDGNENAVGVSDGYSPPEQYGVNNINAPVIDLSAENRVTSIDTSLNTVSDDEDTLIDQDGYKATLIDSHEYTQGNIDNNRGQAQLLSHGNADNIKTLIEEKNKYMLKSESDYTKTLMDSKQEQPAADAAISMTGKVDVRSDIYSMGAAMYFLVTGERPEISIGTVTPLCKKSSKVSESFAAIIDKAMQKEPAKRFKSAEQMLKALNNLRRYDKRYKSMLLKQEIAIIAVISAMVLSGLTAAFGYSRLETEDLEQYISYVDEMDNTDFGLSKEYYDKAIELYPKYAEAYEKMANMLYDSEDYYAAAEYINDVINGGQLYISENGEKYLCDKLYYLLGRCYLETGEYDLSSAALEKAAAINSNESKYFCDYAVALARNGDTEKAESVLEIAVKKGLTDDKILFVRGEIEYSLKNYSASIENLKKCIETTEDDTIKYRAYVICANAYADSYDSKSVSCGECTAFYDSAIEVLPVEKTLPFYEMSARVNIAEGQITDDTSYYAAAISDYEKMNSLGWETIEADYSLIWLYRYVGNYDYAKKFALELLEKNGEDFTLYKLLAYVESDIQGGLDFSRRDYSAFSEYYKKAKKLCADSEDFEMQWLDEAYEKLIEEEYIKR